MCTQTRERSMIVTAIFAHAFTSACDVFGRSMCVVWALLRTTFLFSKLIENPRKKRRQVSSISFFRCFVACKAGFLVFWASVRTTCRPFAMASARFWGGLDV